MRSSNSGDVDVPAASAVMSDAHTANMEDTSMQLSAALSSEFTELYASKVIKKLPESAALQQSLETLETLQHEYLAKQVQQNVFDKIMRIETRDELADAAAVAAATAADVHSAHRRSKLELQKAVQERARLVLRIEHAAHEVEAEKQRVAALEAERAAFERERERLTGVWKDLQRRNAQRKATLQMATGLLVNDEDDCTRAIEQQTRSIHELHHKQKRLEEKKIDAMTQVKKTQEKIRDVVKRNDLRSKDVEAQQRQEDYFSLQRMKQWYDDMLRITSQLSAIAVSHISNEFMEVTVCSTHALRFFYDAETLRVRHVELAQHDAVADDLIAIVLRDNDVPFFLCEYRERISSSRA